MSDRVMLIKDLYTQFVRPALQREYSVKSFLAVPRLSKVVINIGFGPGIKDAKLQEVMVKTLHRISGQRPVITKARKSISNFKIREGMPIGAMVTLRGQRMYDFLSKLVNVALPRVRDFRGLNIQSIDSSGNLTLGFKEHMVFPEIRSDEIESIHGLEVIIATTAGTKARGQKLFELLGFPFRKE